RGRRTRAVGNTRRTGNEALSTPRGAVRGRLMLMFFFFQAEDGIRDRTVTGVQTCALPISPWTVCSIMWLTALPPAPPTPITLMRSEERRVGKECRSRWAREHSQKKREGGIGERGVPVRLCAAAAGDSRPRV